MLSGDAWKRLHLAFPLVPARGGPLREPQLPLSKGHPLFRNHRDRRWRKRRWSDSFVVQDRLCASDVIHRDRVGGRWR